MIRPTQFKPLSTTLEAACVEYMEFLAADNFYEDSLCGYESQVFEAAMEAVYGENIWEEVRRIRDEQEEAND